MSKTAKVHRTAYVSAREAREILGGIGHDQFVRALGAGLAVRTWQLPGMPVRYHRADLERAARAAFKPAELATA